MKKIILRKSQLTRQKMANPFLDKNLEERLIKSNAIDLRDNCTIEDLGNGYLRIKIHDKSKMLIKL